MEYMPYRAQIDCNEREICFHALIFYRRIRPINRQPEVEINRRIRDREIRLIGENGEQLGIMSADAANRIADEKNLDLVKISPQSTPPVCKLMDYSKYKFEKSKKDKEAKRNQKQNETKKIWRWTGEDLAPVLDERPAAGARQTRRGSYA